MFKSLKGFGVKFSLVVVQNSGKLPVVLEYILEYNYVYISGISLTNMQSFILQTHHQRRVQPYTRCLHPQLTS